MRAIEILKDEHDAVLAVLSQLDRAVDAAKRGSPIPADIFLDIGEFFAVFVDHCHHGKEESELFPRLGIGEDADVVAALERDHHLGRGLAAAYGDAARAYVPGDPMSAERLASSAWKYGSLLRVHIDHETRELFPVVERTLAAEDERLIAAFDRIEEEQIGAGTHERLHDMIATLEGRITSWCQ